MIRREALALGGRVHAFAATAMAAAARADSDEPACPKCGEAMSFKQNRPIRIRSVLSGQPAVAEGPYFLCWDCGVGRQPLRECLGLDSDERQRKRMTTIWLDRIKKGDADRMLRSVARANMRQRAGSAAQTALADLHRYLDSRRHLLDYPATIVEGLPIGSGAAARAINPVLQQRMKHSGMRWKLPGARRMAALRCAYRSTGGLPAVFSEMRRAA